VFTLGDDDREISAPPGTYVYIPPGTRHSFRSRPPSAGSTTHWFPAVSTTGSPSTAWRQLLGAPPSMILVDFEVG